MISARLFFFLLICAILVVGIINCVFGIYFDGGSDVYAYHVIRGDFTSAPVAYFSSFGFYPFSSAVIAWFYRLSPQLPWFDLLVFFNISLAAFLFLLLWRLLGFSRILFAVFLIPWLDNILLPELTKEGFWVAFLGLQVYFACDSRQRWLRAFAAVAFAYAFMIRAEPAFLALVSFCLYLLAGSFFENRRQLSAMCTRLLPFILIAVIFSVLLNINWTAQDRLYRSFRPYQFTLWDFRQDPSTIRLHSTADSVILMAAQDHFISDLSRINKPFFDKIGLHQKDKTISSLTGYFEGSGFLADKVVRELKSAGQYLWPVLAFLLLMLAGAAMSTQLRKTDRLSLALVCSAGILLIAFFCVFMKLERHLLFPLVMGTVLHLLTRLSLPKSTSPLQIIVCLAASAVLSYNVVAQYHMQRRYADTASALSADAGHRFPTDLLYMDLYTMVSVHGRLFEREPFPYQRALSFDNAIISYYPEWRDKMLGAKQPATIQGLAGEFERDSSGKIFIFNKGRQHIFEKYFYSIYGNKIDFEEIPSAFSADPVYPFSYYRLSRHNGH